MTLGACVQSGKPPLSRSLPPVALIVPEPVSIPVPKAGDDARVALAEAVNAGLENVRRIRRAEANYSALRRLIGGE